DHIYMLENAIYSVISPEGAASILWKDVAKAKEAAESLKLNAEELKRLAIIDDIIPEPRGGAQRDMTMQVAYLKVYLKKSLNELQELSTETLLDNRWNKYRKIGIF